MPDAIHDIHKRKRQHIHKEQYPHPIAYKRHLDRTIYIIGIISPLMGAIQSYKIWESQEAASISLSMFSFNLFANILWFSYGITHKEKPIIIMYTLWFFVNLSIVTGILLYR
jgi:uncharacterized protein with PQ loop repeat